MFRRNRLQVYAGSHRDQSNPDADEGLESGAGVGLRSDLELVYTPLRRLSRGRLRLQTEEETYLRQALIPFSSPAYL